MIVKEYNGNMVDVIKEGSDCIICNKSNTQEVIINNIDDAVSLVDCLRKFIIRKSDGTPGVTIRGME